MIKKEKKLEKPHLTGNSLLIVQDLWQTRYEILLIILLKKFIKLNVNKETMIKNVRLEELNTKFATAFLNTETFW